MIPLWAQWLGLGALLVIAAVKLFNEAIHVCAWHQHRQRQREQRQLMQDFERRLREDVRKSAEVAKARAESGLN